MSDKPKFDKDVELLKINLRAGELVAEFQAKATTYLSALISMGAVLFAVSATLVVTGKDPLAALGLLLVPLAAITGYFTWLLRRT
jgi:uncharacterized membrane protein